MNQSRSAAYDGPVLKIDDLTVAYRQGGAWLGAVRNVSLELPAGQVCGLVGESGSGKTTLALAIMRYLPEEGQVRQGRIEFGGRNLLALRDREMRQVWGRQMALVPQDPLASLNPSLRMGRQTAEILRHHEGLGAQEARDRVLSLFDSVRLSDPERVADSYPHQISGGMLQRVLIAMAISTEPLLLVMDEPTSSLDVTTEAAILELLGELIRGRRTSVLYITHNLGVVAQVSDRVVVLYAGEVFEDAPTSDLFQQPLHPYTWGLLDCVPLLGQHKAEVQLRPIKGRIPQPDAIPQGCIFRPRCPLAIHVCHEHPPRYESGPNRWARCHRWEAIEREEVSARQPAPEKAGGEREAFGEGTTLRVEGVRVYFDEGRSLLERLTGEAKAPVKAVDGVDLTVARAKTLGLVGESGSGKTTLARAIVGLVRRTEGSVQLHETPLPPALKGRGEDVLSCVQIVFQNPDEALNPYLSVGETLRRPVVRLQGISRAEADEQVARLLDAVHLPEEYARRLPGQLSGGQKQRVAVARAFAPNPDLFIADEPVTSLDVSVQASLLNLFNELQADHGNSTLFISHDLAVVGYLADEVAVMYLGQLMETGPSRAVFRQPYHPYTEALLSSVPIVGPEKEGGGIELEGEIPSPSEEISGCPFHTRCHRFLGDICVEAVPPWREDEGSGKRIFCHIPLDELRHDQEPPATLRRSAASPSSAL
jgi:peptide/nickel transport system ATP-binding protein